MRYRRPTSSMTIPILAVVAAGLVPAPRAGAQDPAVPPPVEAPAAAAPLRVADLAWLAGGWRGTMGEAPIEEHWTAPDGGGPMLGMFRWGMAREMYELTLLEDTPEGVVLRLRHFGPALDAWETGTANDFRPVEHGPCWVLFAEVDDEVERTRLRYARGDDGDLVVHFIEQRDGADRTMEFRFHPLAPAAVPAGCG